MNAFVQQQSNPTLLPSLFTCRRCTAIAVFDAFTNRGFCVYGRNSFLAVLTFSAHQFAQSASLARQVSATTANVIGALDAPNILDPSGRYMEEQLAIVPADPAVPMSTDDSDPATLQRPSNRGKFSPDRDTWERIHQQRYMQWQLGDSIPIIAADHGVTYNAIKNSIRYCEGRMRMAEVAAGRNIRLKLRTLAELEDKYVAGLQDLLSDPSPLVRLKALEQIRKTVGDDHVHVDQVKIESSVTETFNFESAIQRIREAQEARRYRDQPRLIPKPASDGASCQAESGTSGAF